MRLIHVRQASPGIFSLMQDVTRNVRLCLTPDKQVSQEGKVRWRKAIPLR